MRSYVRWGLLLALAAAVLVGRAETGAFPAVTTRVSVDSAGNEANGASYSPAMSVDGRYVAFASAGSNLVPGDTNGTDDMFVHDRQTGATERVSVDSLGKQANASSGSSAISDDGRYVGFGSYASNLVPGDTNGNSDVFVHDRQTAGTTRVSVDSAGNQGNGPSESPAMSANGRYVSFGSGSSNLVPGDTNGFGDIFVHDRHTGTTTRASVDSAGNQGNGHSWSPAISADGRYVAFQSDASNLVSGDTNGTSDIFVHDRQTGVTRRVTVDSAGNQGNSGSGGRDISADGRYVAFESVASNLVPGDTNGVSDIFAHDRGPDPVGGMAELPDVSGPSVPYAALAGGLAAALAFAAGGWYARKRWLRQ